MKKLLVVLFAVIGLMGCLYAKSTTVEIKKMYFGEIAQKYYAKHFKPFGNVL